MKSLRWVAICLLALGASHARAATQSVSYSTWMISGNVIELRFLLPNSEAQRLMGVDLPVVTVAKVGDYLLRQVKVRSASGECAALDQGYDLGLVDPLAVAPGFYGFEIFYRCEDVRQLVLHDAALFAGAPHHVNIARVFRNGSVVEHLFTADSQQWRLSDDGVSAPPALATYLSLGAWHILHSADRLCFVFGLVLLIQRRRDVGYIFGALVLGYGLSLLTSRGGWVMPRETMMEAFVGLLVALLGFMVVLVRAERNHAVVIGWTSLLLVGAVVAAATHSSAAASLLVGGAALSAGLLAASGWHESRLPFWPILAGLLGFVDGFVWSSIIEPSQLPPATQTRMLIGVDLGALLVEAGVAAVLVAVFLALRAQRFAPPRPLINDLCAALLAGCGTFWLASRLWI